MPMPVSFVQGTVPAGGLKLICANVCVKTGTSEAVAVNAPLLVGLKKNAPFTAPSETPVSLAAAGVGVAADSAAVTVVSATRARMRVPERRLIGALLPFFCSARGCRGQRERRTERPQAHLKIALPHAAKSPSPQRAAAAVTYFATSCSRA